MWLQELSISNFRNLAAAQLQFHPVANYLFGPNAAGKTSLLEAIHYLAIGRSFRSAQDRDMLQFGAAALRVQGVARQGAPDSSGLERRGEIRSDGQIKKLLLDGVEIERLSSYLGWLPVVTMLLDDIRLIRSGPSERRAFLDLALAKVSRPYLLALAEYRRVLMHRNRLLTQLPDEKLLGVWDEQLVNAGSAVCQLRARYLPELLQAATESAAQLFGLPELHFSYQPAVKPDGDIRANFFSALARSRPREQQLGITLVGPHRDELLIRKAAPSAPAPGSPEPPGIDLRRFGSEGEQRSASIALKLAEARLLRNHRHETPVFLLDEIASELDGERSARLFTLLRSQGQLFYAAAKPIPAEGMIFQVADGNIRPVNGPQG